MRSHHLFLLIYLTALCCYWGTSDAQRNETCHTQELCTQAGDPTSNFLQCVGLPATDTGRDHLQNLKDTIDAALDVYSFMRSSLSQTPVLGLELGISVNPEAEAYQDEDLIKVWMEVKLKPLLSSISRGFLTCLSNKNFSCNTYQTMVEELSDHFSEMDPVRQRWIYMFFMYPFLSGERAAGGATPVNSGAEGRVVVASGGGGTGEWNPESGVPHPDDRGPSPHGELHLDHTRVPQPHLPPILHPRVPTQTHVG
ncbi:uncharacterized protein [Salmo salar]|uniref:Uncharacterized protein n=1 Tax=Salmo salar TaxID=8030 RepID=A0ABM3CJ53_SALSA|nr:uncharacterized protein LOC106590818 [Salmo salar]